ncbi:head GIN domain-containing protein [Ferruginibacter sp.]
MKQLLVILSAFVMLNSCDYTTGSGNVITETRNVGNFNSISVSSSFDVEVKIGTTAAIRVEADDNIMKYIVTNVSGNELRIKMEGMHSLNNVHMKLFITTPSLIRINADASATVKVLDIIKDAGKLSFTATSSADIEAEVDAPEVEAQANSSGSVTLSGKTKNYKAQVSSSGDIKSAGLLSENADVEASSSGSADVYASVSLNANASSSGSIDYHGGATVKQSVSSSGSVEKKE